MIVSCLNYLLLWEWMCCFETSVCGHQLPPRMDASLQCGCGHIWVMSFQVLVLKWESQWSTRPLRELSQLQYGKLSSWITRSILWYSDLRVAPSRALVPCLVLQVMQILRDRDKVAQIHPKSSGLRIRSLGPLTGRRGFRQVGSTWHGPLG
jgi:hypothetical protein